MIPIVLHHGLLGFSNIQIGKLKINYFSKIDRALAENGNPLIISRVHPTAGIATRAIQLKQTILQQLEIQKLADQRVLIIAHSLGGLDARYMIKKLGMESRIAALLTITTPHRGSPYADWCVTNLGQRLGGFKLMKMLNLDMQAISDLTLASCERFNDEITDSKHVQYFSISCAKPRKLMPPWAYHSHKVVADVQGENDGLVAVNSSTWANHLGTWPIDHWHAINKRFSMEIKNRVGDVSPMYLKAVDQVLRKI
jgi:triacylglycerol lipase